MSVSLILGDVHLGKGINIGKPGIGSGLNSRIIDQLNILEWVLQQAIESNVSNLIITGDIFEDPKPTPAIISLFLIWLKKCTDENIKVHLITGNHDMLRSGQYYMSAFDVISAAEMENVFVYNTISSFDIDGVSFLFIPFRDRKSFNKNSNSEALQLLIKRISFCHSGLRLDNKKIAVGHIALENSIPIGDELDDLSNELFCPLSAFEKYDYVYMGHIHKPQILLETPYISHIGSMDISDFKEADQKKNIAIIDTDAKDLVRYVKIPTRPLNQIDVKIPDNTENTTQYVLNYIKNSYDIKRSILKLNIDFGNTNLLPVNRDVLEKELNDLGVFHIYRISEERKLNIIQKENVEKIDNSMNEATAVKIYAASNVDENIRNDFISLACSIIDEYNSTIKG